MSTIEKLQKMVGKQYIYDQNNYTVLHVYNGSPGNYQITILKGEKDVEAILCTEESAIEFSKKCLPVNDDSQDKKIAKGKKEIDPEVNEFGLSILKNTQLNSSDIFNETNEVMDLIKSNEKGALQKAKALNNAINSQINLMKISLQLAQIIRKG